MVGTEYHDGGEIEHAVYESCLAKAKAMQETEEEVVVVVTVREETHEEREV